MNILLIGSGGREHALARAISQSEKCTQLYIASGNAGTENHGKNINFDVSDHEKVLAFISEKQVGLVVVGPEQPLVDGISDALTAAGIPVVGPKKAGAMLEGSKAFSKRFMQKHDIPTADYRSFNQDEKEAAIQYVQGHSLPVVIKASGLAAGKGVLICETNEHAVEIVNEMLSGDAFGDSGKTIVVEAFLTGIELSVFVLTDGENYKVLPSAKDYKRIGEGDTGLNTGGMGAISPVPFATPDFLKKVEEQVIQPTIQGLKSDGIDYVGFIFIGLMNNEGNPHVIEYNVRLGDPETEVVIPRIESDFVELLHAAATGKLNDVTLRISENVCATVMLVSGGYPGAYQKGKLMSGMESTNNCILFHAGTKKVEGEILTNGGRVMAVTAFGKNIEEAISHCYSNADKVEFEGKYFRKDIGQDLLALS